MAYKKIEDINNLVEIPADIFMNALTLVSEEERQEARETISAYEIFKQAEMTPVILMDVNTYEFFCVARETFNRKLH